MVQIIVSISLPLLFILFKSAELNSMAESSVVDNQRQTNTCPVIDASYSKGFSNKATTLPNGHRILDFTNAPYLRWIIEDHGDQSYIWPQESSESVYPKILELFTNCLVANQFSNIPMSRNVKIHIEPVPTEKGKKIIGLVENLVTFENNCTEYLVINNSGEARLLSANLPKYFPSLVGLELSGNRIKLLTTGNSEMLTQLSKLNRINLDENLIQEIPPKFFNMNHLVDDVELIGNPIRKVGSSAFANVRRVSMSLGSNAKIDLTHFDGVYREVVLYLDKSAVNVDLFAPLPKNITIDHRFKLTLMYQWRAGPWKEEDYAHICPKIPHNVCKVAKSVFIDGLCVKNIDETVRNPDKTSGYLLGKLSYLLCSNV